MTTLTTLLALSGAALLTACANPSAPGAGPMSAAKADPHAAHQAAAPTADAPAAAHERMKAMHHKMMGARTPAERQALMDEHMKAMHEGMSTMKGMGGMGGMGGKPDASGPKPAPMDMARHHQMMERRMEMMQTMMDMMLQRMPGAATPPAGQ